VGVGYSDSKADVVVFVLEGNCMAEGEEEVKNEVGRAMRTTPKRETNEAYCAERGKGSLRKR
jgi:hypothetical protein